MKKPHVNNAEVVKGLEKRSKSTRRAVAMDLVTAPVRKADGETAGESRALVNPWEDIETMHGVIEPPFDPYGLTLVEENSNELRQCAEAMEINIPGYGWRLRRLKTAQDPALDDVAEEERERLKDILTYADYDEGSFTSLRRRTRHDMELTGNAYWEVIRDKDGLPQAFRHVTHFSMRLRPIHPEVVEVVRRRPKGRGNARAFVDVRIRKRFRAYVQAKLALGTAGPTIVHFKEYGDPRVMDWRTGRYVPEGESIPAEDQATEILHWRLYNARTPYGVPRYVGALLSIFGSRAAEEINYTTFKNNLVPSMMLMVSNGQATDDSLTRIQEFMTSQVQGSDNYSKFLIVEAEPFDEEGTDAVKMDLKPLTKEQHTDEMFQIYDKNNRERVRQSFRLPPLFVGRSDDYTRTTAETSRRVADEQVFDPERRDEDWTINRILVQDLEMLYHEFVTNTPNVTNDQDLIQVMGGAEKVGAMTPRVGHAMLEDILSRELPDPVGVKLDVPFSLQMAEAVKNLAQPNEVGQQITALKDAVATNDAEWVDKIQAAMVAKLTEGDDKEPASGVAINAGSQAADLADGSQRALLSTVALSLTGRTMFLGDGAALHARVRFGECKRVGVDTAAVAAGLDVSDVRAMFPGKVELWAAMVEARDRVEPTAYEQPDGSLFAVVNRG